MGLFDGITNKETSSFKKTDGRSVDLPTSATRHAPHVSATNSTAKHLKGKPNHGKLGGRGHDV